MLGLPNAVASIDLTTHFENMSIFAVSLLLAQQQTTVANPTAQKIQFFGMLAIFGVMFYLLMIRPQQKRASEHEKLLKALKPGDKVVTTSGIVGVVVTMKDKSVTLRSA